jgi:hypothetical protein
VTGGLGGVWEGDWKAVDRVTNYGTDYFQIKTATKPTSPRWHTTVFQNAV